MQRRRVRDRRGKLWKTRRLEWMGEGREGVQGEEAAGLGGAAGRDLSERKREREEKSFLESS